MGRRIWQWGNTVEPWRGSRWTVDVGVRVGGTFPLLQPGLHSNASSLSPTRLALWSPSTYLIVVSCSRISDVFYVESVGPGDVSGSSQPQTPREPQLCYLLIAARDLGCDVPGNCQIPYKPSVWE